MSSELVTISPAIGLSSSDTWNPPLPVEIGRTYSFGGINLGDNGTVGQAASGSYLLTLPNWFGDAPPIDEYEISYGPVVYSKFSDQLNCDGTVAVAGEDWYVSDSLQHQTVTVSATTIPTTIKFNFIDWFDSYECSGNSADIITAVNAIDIEADSTSISIFTQNKIEEFLDPGQNPAGIPKQIKRKQCNLVGRSIRITFKQSGSTVFEDYIDPSVILIP